MAVVRKLVLPDGEPAAGADVLIRVFRPDNSVRDDTRARTDDKGVLSVEVEAPEQGQSLVPTMRLSGYLLVKAPDCALCVAPLQIPQGAEVMPVRLQPQFSISGTVVDDAAAPVAHARVTVISLASGSGALGGSVWLNAPLVGITTPEFTVVSAEDGTFSLPGVTGPEGMPFTAYFYAATDDLICNEIYTRIAPNATPIRLRLSHGLTVSGRVLNAVTGEPVKGARVALRGSPGQEVGGRSPVITDEQGAFRHVKIPRLIRLFCTAEADDLVDGWEQVSGEQSSQDVVIKLRPWATVSGKLVDGATGAAPVVRCPEVSARYRDGTNNTEQPVMRPGVAKAEMAADGTFTVRTAAGPNTISAWGSAFRSEDRMLIDVPTEGLEGLVVPVRRMKCFLVKFTSDRAVDFMKVGLQHKDAEGKAWSEGTGIPGGVWVRAAKEWGATMEIRVSSAEGELLPWTEIVADPNNWPLVLKLK